MTCVPSGLTLHSKVSYLPTPPLLSPVPPRPVSRDLRGGRGPRITLCTKRARERERDNANAKRERGRSMAPNSIFRHRHLDRRRGWRCTSGIPERRKRGRESPTMNVRGGGGGERGVGVAKSRSPVPPSECASKSKCCTM